MKLARIVLKNCCLHIPQLIYLVKKDNDTTFVKTLKRNTINATFISYLSEEELNKVESAHIFHVHLSPHST